MVFEFPELQGTMGGIYAREEGLPEQVWKAIYYQYLPIGVEADAPPSRAQLGAAAVTWAAVSLADKLDTSSALTNAGERATGSRDPFGLRRQMQGVVRILMDLPELTGVDRELGLRDLVVAANEQFGGGGRTPSEPTPSSRSRTSACATCSSSAAIRAKSCAARRPAAAMSCRCAPCAWPRRCRRMRGSEDFQALAVLFKRVKNIARELTAHAPLDRAALTEPAELALLAELDARRPRIEQAARAARLSTGVHRARRRCGRSVDRFFTEVFVMADDARVRTARLTLMADLRDLILDLADISEIVPQTE